MLNNTVLIFCVAIKAQCFFTIRAPILGTYSSPMLSGIQQNCSPETCTLHTNLLDSLWPRWFHIGHSQVITQNIEYPRALLPQSTPFVSLTGDCNVSLEKHTGAACLNAVYVMFAYGSQGVPTHVREK